MMGRFAKTDSAGSTSAITLLNGLHLLRPTVPMILVKFREVGHYFTYKPWNAIGRTLIAGFGWESFNPPQSWLSHPTRANNTAIMFMSGNALFVLFLMAMRRHFVWWPFHPGGYVLSGGGWSGMLYIWNAMLISWAIKWVILRYGGMKACKIARPFFFGLVLGDYIIGCAWNIIGLIFDTPAYSIWQY
jgi:hypothetical protein